MQPVNHASFITLTLSTINRMRSNLSFNRKLFSHSIKNMLSDSPKRLNPELTVISNSPPSRVSFNLKSLRKKTKASFLKLQEQHKAYEKMIDELMRKHIEDQKLPLALPKISVRHIYNKYRVVDINNTDIYNRSGQLHEKLQEIGEKNPFQQRHTQAKDQLRRPNKLQISERSHSFDLPALKINRSVQLAACLNAKKSHPKIITSGRGGNRSYTQG